MITKLNNKKVAILATDGFEQSELDAPLDRLRKEGASVHVVSIQGKSKIKGWDESDWGKDVGVDKDIKSVSSNDYDALMLPGGLINPDQLRQNEEAVGFIRGFFEGERRKPVAAICHAPQLLIEAGVTKGRMMTSYPSIKTDITNSGAHWQDNEVVTDNGLVTSRSPKDMEVFLDKMVEEFREGPHS